MRRMLRRSGWTALAVGLLAFPAALALIAAFGTTVTPLTKVWPADEIAYYRQTADARDDVVKFYGVPHPGGPVTYLFVDTEELIVPEEAPDDRYWHVDPARGDDPLTDTRTRALAGILAAAGVLFGGVMLVATRKRPTRAGSDTQ